MRIKRMGKHTFPLPSVHRQGDLAYDLRANTLATELKIFAGDTVTIGTGFAFEFEPGQGGQVILRSGHASKGLLLMTSGLIDSNYRGEILIVVKNISNKPILIEDGERFAQMMFIRPEFPCLQEATEINKTYRGDQGYGSSGRE